MQLFGCPSTWSAPARAFYGSKLSLLLDGRCVLGCWAVGCSRDCDVWGGIDWRCWGGGVGGGVTVQGRALGSCSPGAAAVHAGLGYGGCQQGGFDLGICSDGYFDHTSFRRSCLPLTWLLPRSPLSSIGFRRNWITTGGLPAIDCCAGGALGRRWDRYLVTTDVK